MEQVIMKGDELNQAIELVHIPANADVVKYEDKMEAMYKFEDHQPIYQGQKRTITIEYYVP
jgi:hypothetical protein